MKYLFCDETTLRIFAHINGKINHKRHRYDLLAPTFTKDNRAVIPASVLDICGENDKYRLYCNILPSLPIIEVDPLDVIEHPDCPVE